HEDLQRAGRRRLAAAATAGVALLALSVALLVLPIVAATVFVFSPLFATVSTSSEVLRTIVISLGIGGVTSFVATAFAWHHAERDALRSADLQLATVPGTRLDVVPSWRVANEALPRVRHLLDALSIAAGVLPPRCAVVVDPAPNLLSIGRRPETAWIVCTTGLLDELPRRELEAVLAYELGRVACREVSLDTVVYACTARTYEVWGGAIGGHHGTLVYAPLAILGLPLLAGCAVLRRAALSARARLSDGLAVQFSRDPIALLAALRRLDADSRTVRFAGTPNAHLWLQYPHTRASRWLLGTRRLLGARVRRLERLTASIR
ncbi:MAG: heat shock protein HtpX, partial [Actinomycetia bacterium]|nr:heat shock protein HtpX [Actinomycetes bacterium]